MGFPKIYLSLLTQRQLVLLAIFMYLLERMRTGCLWSPLVDTFPYSTSSEIFPNLLNFLQILSILISGRGADHQEQTKLCNLLFFLFYFHLNILYSFNLHAFAFVSKTGYDPLALLFFFFPVVKWHCFFFGCCWCLFIYLFFYHLFLLVGG